jgi:hypothetical protein
MTGLAMSLCEEQEALVEKAYSIHNSSVQHGTTICYLAMTTAVAATQQQQQQ